MSQCVRHPEAEASFTCARCGDYRCEECLRSIGEREFCPRCYELELRSGAASYWSIGAALLGFFGIGCAPLGWIAILFGIVGLAQAARTQSSAGRGLAMTGIALGMVGTVILFAWLLMTLSAPTDVPGP